MQATKTSGDWSYPVNIKIEYDNDEEYRQSICKLFRHTDTATIEYDDDEFYHLIHCIEEKTSSLPVFRTLYIAAAAHLLSDEIQVGIVVLLSYDYLVDFHILLCNHFTNRSTTDDAISTLLCTIRNHTTR
jgi:hypothetical protein